MDLQLMLKLTQLNCIQLVERKLITLFIYFRSIIFYYYPLDECLFSKERQKGGRNEWEEMFVELRKVGGEETISEYIFKKIYFQ